MLKLQGVLDAVGTESFIFYVRDSLHSLIHLKNVEQVFRHFMFASHVLMLKL